MPRWTALCTMPQGKEKRKKIIRMGASHDRSLHINQIWCFQPILKKNKTLVPVPELDMAGISNISTEDSLEFIYAGVPIANI